MWVIRFFSLSMKSLIIATQPVNWSISEFPDKYPKSLLDIDGSTILGRLLDDIDGIPTIYEHFIITNENDSGIFRFWANKQTGTKPITIINKDSFTEETRLGFVRDIILDIKAYDLNDDLLVIPADCVLDFSLKSFVDSFNENLTSMTICCNNKTDSFRQMNNTIVVGDNQCVMSYEEKSSTSFSESRSLPFYIFKKADLLLIKKRIEGGMDYSSSSCLLRYLLDNSSLHVWEMEGREYLIEDSRSYEDAKAVFNLTSKKGEINGAQRSLLEDSIEITRLDSANEKMVNRFREFSCNRNLQIESFLKGEGVTDNRKGKLAVFYIENKRGKILMIFSICCGMIFKPEEYDADQAFMLNQLHQGKISNEVFLQETSGWDPSKWVISDSRSCDNNDAVYADVDFPAVELVHICNNDNAGEIWPKLGMPNRMGETLFWSKIVPFIIDLNKKVGFNYMYLYAADNKRIEKGGKLIKHYESAFAFCENPNIGIIKPRYNKNCTFMAQSIRELEINRKTFFDYFNR